MTNTEQMNFKEEYINRMKASSKSVLLTQQESERHDIWAYNRFGDENYAFMFKILITNVQYAKTVGYEILS